MDNSTEYVCRTFLIAIDLENVPPAPVRNRYVPTTRSRSE